MSVGYGYLLHLAVLVGLRLDISIHLYAIVEWTYGVQLGGDMCGRVSYVRFVCVGRLPA